MTTMLFFLGEARRTTHKKNSEALSFIVLIKYTRARYKGVEKTMTDRSKTSLILGTAALIMFSPLAMVLIGHQIPMFRNLGFEKNSLASPLTWLLATMVGAGYVIYTMITIPFVAGKQREFSLF